MDPGVSQFKFEKLKTITELLKLRFFYFIFYFYFFWLAQEMQQNCSHIPLQTKLTSEIPLKLFGILSHQQRRTYHQRSSCPILVICSLLYLTTQRIDASSS